MDDRVTRIHAICERIRADHWVGIDESRAYCRQCPETDQTAYGPGTRGCFLLAMTCYSIATRPASSAGDEHGS